MTHWRNKFKVHPAADLFPMMSDEELDALAADIKANGLTIPVLFWRNGEDRNGEDRVLIDGRNRLEAMERAGLDPLKAMTETFTCKDPVTHITSLNIHRRHLTKEQKADLIVAAHKAAAEASRQAGEVPKRHVRGKAGSEKDATKAAAVATAKEHGISKRTVERAIAKAEGSTPEPKRYAARPLPKPQSGKPIIGIEAARRHYLDHCAEPGVDLDGEQEIIIDALREIAGKRAMQPAEDDLGNIPAGLDRRRQP